MTAFFAKYVQFYRQLSPPTWWKALRFVLHWLTLPIKLLVIGGWSVYLHIYMFFFWKKRKLSDLPHKAYRKTIFLELFKHLPVFKSDLIELYVNRVPIFEPITGKNHNTDHQAARHGTYSFLMSLLHKRTPQIDTALRMHLQKSFGICRGYKQGEGGQLEFNGDNTSGDQLLGLALGMLHCNDPMTQEEYELALLGIINNDYAIKSEDGLSKSAHGMWQPGLETVGAQALTILAALRIGCLLKLPSAKTHYKKLMWKYGYGLLSLFPTTWSFKNRNYSNDHNCIVGAYILAKTSKGLAKWYWTFVALYVWSLSYKWYNGYYTGLIRDIHPKLISDKYVEECQKYMYEEPPLNFAKSVYWHPWVDAKTYPVKFNDMNQGEFFPDEVQQERHDTSVLTRSGLGWLASVVMLDPKEAWEFLQ